MSLSKVTIKLPLKKACICVLLATWRKQSNWVDLLWQIYCSVVYRDAWKYCFRSNIQLSKSVAKQHRSFCQMCFSVHCQGWESKTKTKPCKIRVPVDIRRGQKVKYTSGEGSTSYSSISIRPRLTSANTSIVGIKKIFGLNRTQSETQVYRRHK